MGAPVTLTPAPAVAVELVDVSGHASAICTCGFVQICPTTQDATATAELHSIRCPQFRRWAHEQIDNLSFALGYYIPAQVLNLLHVLVDQPAAATQIMPWLYGLDGRGNA